MEGSAGEEEEEEEKRDEGAERSGSKTFSIIPSEMRNASVIPNRRNVLGLFWFGWTRSRPDPRTGYLACKLFFEWGDTGALSFPTTNTTDTTTDTTDTPEPLHLAHDSCVRRSVGTDCPRCSERDNLSGGVKLTPLERAGGATAVIHLHTPDPAQSATGRRRDWTGGRSVGARARSLD